MIAGITPADSGTITWKNDLSVGLLQQTLSFDPNKSVLSILESSFSELNYIQDKMRELEFKMTRDQPAIQKIIQTYGEIQEEYIIDNKLCKYNKNINELSDFLGGQKSEITQYFCQVLIQKYIKN